ncbi:MAG: hypothetical protein PHO28_03975, partial [Candidatus Pacebacteria bacterium]|nr:hypothetical protein [Candidatus Paceibacterota bacterium]
ARNYVNQSTFALSSRPYETGDYLNIKTIEAQQKNFDYLTDPNEAWDRLYQSFLAKNPDEFLFYSQEMGINTVIEYKLIKSGGKFPDPVKFFKEKNLLKEIVNNESVGIYQISY